VIVANVASVITVNVKRIFSKYNRFSIGFVTSWLFMLLVVSCIDRWAIGKDIDEINEEIARSLFQADSLFMSINAMFDTTKIETVKINVNDIKKELR
tara:strand:+ start:251 stop:541 length:291 start_codon:yes stop_codon:yes gene_type:complete